MTTTYIALGCTLLGALVGWLGYRASVRKEDKDEGKENGTILTELGYIKGGIDDLKAENREQRKTNTEFISRLTAVEASAKQAHKRLDTLEERQERS